MKKVGILICALILLVSAAPSTEKMTKIPGYPDDFNTSIYTGYLDVKSADRALHYVFVESINGPNNKDPVTLWLNGGPGCSSLMGFLQQIGPYYLQEGASYRDGDKLTQNKYSWHKVSNLLFLESPAGVGYSYNTNTSMVYTDGITAVDNLNAIHDFFEKFSEYRNNKFWLAGQSYAGKYIPQLAVAIDHYNAYDAPDGKKIDMRGIIVGNGIMQYDTTPNHQVQFLLSHSFINPEIQQYWSMSCQFDPMSAGCGFFSINARQDLDEVNPYNVYGYCYYNDSFGEQKKRKMLSQESILLGIQGKYSKSAFKEPMFNGPQCAYFDGMLNYFNLHEKEYRAKWDLQLWNGPCADNITYQIDPLGSMHDYRKLLGQVVQKGYTIHLFNGNWDVVVPSGDTVANIKKLNLVESYLYTPWFIEDENGKEQHAGFTQIYSGIIFTIVKGASHMVPQSKRAEALHLFKSTLDGHADGLGKRKDK